MNSGSESAETSTVDPAAQRLSDEIRARRKSAGLSQSQLAALVGFTRAYVNRAERPSQGLVSAPLVKAIDETLDANGALVSLHAEATHVRKVQRRRRRNTYVTSVKTIARPQYATAAVIAYNEGRSSEAGVPVDWDPVISGNEGAMLRRDFLRAGSALAVTSIIGASPRGKLSDQDAVRLSTDLHSRLSTLRRLDRTLGGAETYRLYAAEAELSARILNGGGTDKAILNVHVEQSQQAGWAAFDAGWHDIAHDHFRRSYATAIESGDSGLAGNSLALCAYQFITLGKKAQTVTAKSVHLAAQDGVNPGVRAMLYSRAAWTFALNGDVQSTARCLGLAEEAYFMADPAATPDYASWVDRDELDIMKGRCWSVLHRPDRAVPVLESALSRYSANNVRDTALYSSWLAESYIESGEVERATNLVSVHARTAGSIASVRPHKRLATVVDRLHRYHADVPAVQDLVASDPFHPRGERL